DDTLIGGAGADTLDGSTNTDTAGYAASSAGVHVNLGTGTASGGHATGDVLSSIENLIGSDHADYLASNVVASLLDGRAGADTLRGGGAADTLTGGTGDDRLWGHQGDDRLTGGADHDRLDGGTGHDTLDGGAGQDTIIGRSGNDVLTGGADRDVFLFKDNFGTDVITDFEDGIDRILIRADGVRFKDLSITGSGTDVDRAAVITWGAEGDSITLEGVDHTALTRADFIFW
ncbi:MAG: calcium-binding protein, partial [Rhodobacteraceae bacterium]|nr:calcium-binding protein [Paracoccaceae bacterium]